MRIIRSSRGMKTFSVQVTPEQEENIYMVAEFERLNSKAEVMRKAFDYYIQNNYPQLVVG